MLITSLKKQQGTFVADTTEHPFQVEISADQAREIIERALSEGTIQTIFQWKDDEVLSLELSELMELELALETIADEMDYQETIADFLAG
jgi:hypothetical protein